MRQLCAGNPGAAGEDLRNSLKAPVAGPLNRF